MSAWVALAATGLAVIAVALMCASKATRARWQYASEDWESAAFLLGLVGLATIVAAAWWGASS